MITVDTMFNCFNDKFNFTEIELKEYLKQLKKKHNIVPVLTTGTIDVLNKIGQYDCPFTASISPYYTRGGKKEIEDKINVLKDTIHNNKNCVAIGNIGFIPSNYIFPPTPSTIEMEVYLAKTQINLAQEAKKPIYVHIEEDNEYLINIFLWQLKGGENILISCFCGSKAQERFANEVGQIANIYQMICNSDKSVKSSKYIPANRMLVASDAPYFGVDGEVNFPEKGIPTLIERIAKNKKAKTSKIIKEVFADNAEAFYGKRLGIEDTIEQLEDHIYRYMEKKAVQNRLRIYELTPFQNFFEQKEVLKIHDCFQKAIMDFFNVMENEDEYQKDINITQKCVIALYNEIISAKEEEAEDEEYERMLDEEL